MMEIDNETNDLTDDTCEDSIQIEEISLKEMLKDLKLYEDNKDLQVFEKYISQQLSAENCQNIEESTYSEDLDECMEIVTNYVMNSSFQNLEEKIVFRRILFLLVLKKLSILQAESVQSNDLRLLLINNGSILIKSCIENNSYFIVDYYIQEVFKELDIVESEYRDKNISNNYILLKRGQIRMYNVEKLIKENNLEEAFEELWKLKEFAEEFLSYREYFIGLSYNLSLKLKFVSRHESALKILLLVFDEGKSLKHLSENMKKVLHLLVCLCLEYKPLENWQHAANALYLFDSNNIDLFYIIAKIKIAVISKQQSFLEKALNQAYECESMEMENIYAISEFLLENKLSDEATDFMRRFRRKPLPVVDKFLLIKQEIQIFISENDRKAYNAVEDAIAMIRGSNVPSTQIISLYKVLSSYAIAKFEEKMFRDSLKAFNYCAEICEAGNLSPKYLHDIYVRMCLCYLEINEWELAKKYFSKLDKDLFQTDSFRVYLALQISFMSGDEKLAEETLNMYDKDNKTADVLLACCQRALSSGRRNVLFKILEALVFKYHTEESTVLLAKLSQCLIGLCFYSSDSENVQEKYILYLDKALNVLQKNPEHPETAELSQWFSRVAWNLGLMPGIEMKNMFEYFLRCCCFCELSSRNVHRLKNALMLAAASGLQLVRQASPQRDEAYSEKDNILGKVMTVIEKCKLLETGTNINLLRLLYLYEFEAKCHSKKWEDGKESLKEILNLPFMDVKTVEHIAAILHEFAPQHYDIILESLKSAVKKISEKKDERGPEASKTYHSLIQVLFHVQEFISSSVEEENLMLCDSLIKLIDSNVFENYPQLEILWIMTKCWNWGVHKLTLNDTRRAYKWCTLAMSFLKKLDSLKTLHEKKLNDMYSAYFPNTNTEADHSVYPTQK